MLLNLWLRLREGLISSWHILCDYDTKISPAKRQRLEEERAAKKAARAELDERRAIQSAAKAEVKGEIRRKAQEQAAVIDAEVVRTRQVAHRYDPQPQAPQIVYVQPPVNHQTVIVKRGGSSCSDGCAILILLMVGILALSFFGVKTCVSDYSKTSSNPPPRPAKPQAKDMVTITDFHGEKTGFGNVLEASFTLTNTGSVAVKDVRIQCAAAGPSGTIISRHHETIYETINPGESKRIEKINLGFVSQQATGTSTTVVGATEIVR